IALKGKGAGGGEDRTGQGVESGGAGVVEQDAGGAEVADVGGERGGAAGLDGDGGTGDLGIFELGEVGAGGEQVERNRTIDGDDAIGAERSGGGGVAEGQVGTGGGEVGEVAKGGHGIGGHVGAHAGGSGSIDEAADAVGAAQVDVARGVESNAIGGEGGAVADAAGLRHQDEAADIALNRGVAGLLDNKGVGERFVEGEAADVLREEDVVADAGADVAGTDQGNAAAVGGHKKTAIDDNGTVVIDGDGVVIGAGGADRAVQAEFAGGVDGDRVGGGDLRGGNLTVDLDE